MAMGDRFGIPTTSFNLLVGRKQIINKSRVPHTIIRTVEDPVSTPMALARGKKNYTVKSVDPIRGLGDPKSVHDLNQFTSAGPRQPGGIDALMTEGVRRFHLSRSSQRGSTGVELLTTANFAGFTGPSLK